LAEDRAGGGGFFPEGSAPALTMPEAEAEALRAAYKAAKVILEYGSGGSTVLAAGLANRRVFSVESDADWLRGMEGWFAANPPAAKVMLHHADIGPTEDWGRPKDDSRFRRWWRYPHGVWERPDFRHPDVVLIDGRFRAACLLTVAFRISRPVVALFDDYTTRPAYHEVEAVVRPATLIGRMAIFDLEPMPIPPDRLGWLVNMHLRPL
jgi:hypothetical protein